MVVQAVRQRRCFGGQEIPRHPLARRAQPSQKSLTEPIGCMFLAGEAAHETLWGTVDGAWESGERAAEAALRRIGALRDEPATPAPVAKRRRAAPARSAKPGAPIN